MARVEPPSALQAEPRTVVCAGQEELREQIAEAVTAGGAPPVAVVASIADLEPEAVDGAHDCLIVGVSRATRSAVEDAAAMAESLGSAAAVLVCETARDAEVRLALELGVRGVVLAANIRVLAAVVQAVAGGQISVPRDVQSQVRAKVLTTRERQILSLVVMGMTNGEIARRLYLAESTVKSHLSSAFAKLNVSSRNEAVMVILDPKLGEGLGILTIPSESIPTRA